MSALLLAAAILLGQPQAAYCSDMRITAYVRTEHGTHTADGTPITTPEPIVAASYDIPLGHYVDIADLGTFRVADRGGGLGSSGWLDVAVWTRAEAFALTSVREVCVYPPGALR